MELYFCGDSHLWVPKHAYELGHFGSVQCKFEIVGGATAVGLRHPTSKTEALQRFRECLLPPSIERIPILQLGEVDCGFVIWLRAQRYGESIEEQLDASLRAYVSFLTELKTRGYKKILATSATPPTIRDGDLVGDVANIRKEVEATYRERSQLTAEYNHRLRLACQREEIVFVDFTPHFVDPATGLLNEAFRNADPADHHLDRDTAGIVWAQEIKAAIFDGCVDL